MTLPTDDTAAPEFTHGFHTSTRFFCCMGTANRFQAEQQDIDRLKQNCCETIYSHPPLFFHCNLYKHFGSIHLSPLVSD